MCILEQQILLQTNKQGDNISAKTLNVNVTTSTNYYWKVVVKDNKSFEIKDLKQISNIIKIVIVKLKLF